MSNGNRAELSPICSVIMSDLKNWKTLEQECDMLITSSSKEEQNIRNDALYLKTTTATGNSAKYMTTANAHDTNYPITQLINKHATYTVPVEPN